MATIDRALREQWLREPEQAYHVIVRTDSDAAPVAEQCASRGMTVHRTFRLVPGLALTARGDELLALAEEPHITHIELDREVGVSGPEGC